MLKILFLLLVTFSSVSFILSEVNSSLSTLWSSPVSSLTTSLSLYDTIQYSTVQYRTVHYSTMTLSSHGEEKKWMGKIIRVLKVQNWYCDDYDVWRSGKCLVVKAFVGNYLRQKGRDNLFKCLSLSILIFLKCCNSANRNIQYGDSPNIVRVLL